MRKFTLLLLGGIAGCTLSALPPGIEAEDSGAMKIGGVPAAVKIYNQEWRSVVQGAKTVSCEPTYPARYEKLFKLDGQLAFPGTAGFMLQQRITETAADTVNYSCTLKNSGGIPCRSIALSLRLPSRIFDGKELRIDGKPVRIAAVDKPFRDVKRLELVNGDRKITFAGNLTVGIQDHRSNSVPEFSLRLLFSPNGGTVREAKLNTAITVDSLTAVPLELGKTVGGKILDAALKSFGTDRNPRSIGGIPFLPGNGMLKLEAGKSAGFTVTDPGCRELYLLHSAVPGARPVITVTAPDGTKQRHELLPGRDFNVKIPSPRLPNGAVAAANDRTGRGLFFSRFPLGAGKPAAIRFENAGRGEWIVAAATVAENSVDPGSVNSVYYIDEGEEWAPMERVKPVAKGSVLDFTPFVDAPAGKYGRIVTDAEGRFVTEKDPSKRFRFFGPNLCFSAQYLDKATAEKLAEELAALGYNAVRIHHYDNELSDPKGSDSTVFDPKKIDQLDYLFSCFKKRGLYVTLDLYCSRRFRSGELPDAPLRTGYAMKQLAPVYAPARENWKKFARSLLTHRNPYTGMAWGEDPALFAVSLTNENITTGNWARPVPQLYLDAYRSYLEKRNLATPENLASRGGLFHRFLVDLNIDMIDDFSGFLRNGLGYKGLITEINYRKQTILSEIRDRLDFVDNHNYWDHPNSLPGRAWAFPRLHNQKSSIKAAAWSPRTLMPSRIFGKPFTVSEINFVFPNRHRAESGPLLGAYAALQDWDGLFRFTWAHEDRGVRHENPINRFNIVDDSLSQVAERITNLMFVRGDVQAAPTAVAWPYGESMFRDMSEPAECPSDFSMLGMYCRIGSLRENRELPGVTRLSGPEQFRRELTPAQLQAVKNPVRSSETGEISNDPARGTLRVVTPKTESLSFFREGLTGELLAVSGATPTFQIVTASAMDGKPLGESRRILLFHQSDVTNRNIRFSSDSMTAVEHWGVPECLIRRAKAKVELKLPAGQFTVRAVGLDGMPKADVPAEFRDGKLSFTADTAAYGGTMAYLIERK
ncbi:MAG: hypothetical protein HPZ91_06180 [Lentisphaeria bacterium]|nr:hypothetical protein [Lentisphaeria bacterium]